MRGIIEITLVLFLTNQLYGSKKKLINYIIFFFFEGNYIIFNIIISIIRFYRLEDQFLQKYQIKIFFIEIKKRFSVSSFMTIKEVIVCLVQIGDETLHTAQYQVPGRRKGFR